MATSPKPRSRPLERFPTLALTSKFVFHATIEASSKHHQIFLYNTCYADFHDNGCKNIAHSLSRSSVYTFCHRYRLFRKFQSSKYNYTVMCNIFAFIFIAIFVARVIHKYSALFDAGLIAKSDTNSQISARVREALQHAGARISGSGRHIDSGLIRRVDFRILCEVLPFALFGESFAFGRCTKYKIGTFHWEYNIWRVDPHSRFSICRFAYRKSDRAIHWGM